MVSTATISLRSDAYSIVLLKQNGAELKEGINNDFVFTEPRTIVLNAGAPAASDLFLCHFGTELTQDQVLGAISSARQIVKIKLKQRFSTFFTEWDTKTPDSVTEISICIAGIFAERNMIRDGHEFDPNAFRIHQMGLKEWKKLLDDINNGDADLPEIDDEIFTKGGVFVTSSGKDFVFRELDQIADHDVDEFWRQPTRRDRRDVSDKDF
jgi:hypothetical protein